jgi:3-hydroxybutyrate dehydrogenase
MTPLVEKQIRDTAKACGITDAEVIHDVLLAAPPTKRFVTVEELAGPAVFRCPEHAKSITGTLLPVDGGWTAH